MFKHLTKGVCVLVFLAFMLFGCRAEDEEEFGYMDKFHGFYCPSCDETVTWNSYGKCVLREFGSDSWGWKLKSDCGWQIHDKHRGGPGDTLELYSCGDEGVIFIWAWQSFRAFKLAEGWTGETAEGIRLGDSLDDFLTVYPDFVKTDEKDNYLWYELQLDREHDWVEAMFEDEKLVGLSVYSWY